MLNGETIHAALVNARHLLAENSLILFPSLTKQ